MKRLLVIGLTLFFCQNVFAANVKLELAPYDEIIAVSDITLNQVQAKVQCQFKSLADRTVTVRERYILTRLDRIEEGRYRVRTGRAVLNAWLPEYKLEKCGYQLITLGEDLDGNALIGDINLLDRGLDGDKADRLIRKRLAAILVAKQGEHEQARLEDISHY